jgi:hypothetical protein
VAYGREYPLRVRGFEILDIDRDGSTEVFLWTEPNLLQSPTIAIYSIDAAGNVTRAIEGLAPGPLVPASGNLHDTHVMGLGLDFPVEAPAGDGEPDLPQFVEQSRLQGMHVVRYRDFFHSDGRAGQRGYIDLSGADPLSSDGICGTFEFAALDDLAAGSLLEDRDGGYLVAASSGRLYLYRIDSIRPDGLLDKQLWVVDQPPGYVSLVTSTAGIVEYELADGSRRPVRRAP